MQIIVFEIIKISNNLEFIPQMWVELCFVKKGKSLIE